MNDILTKINAEIKCPYLIENGNSSYCLWLSNRLGRLFPTNKHYCNLWCESKGPYSGRDITIDQEKQFIAEAWDKFYPIENGIHGNLASKVLASYKNEAHIEIPKEWPLIENELQFLYGVPGFKSILLTGSIIISGLLGERKDIDVALWFDSAKSLLAFLSSNVTLPSKLLNWKADYFYYIGDDVPDLFFVMLDPKNKKFYLSRWYDINLKTIDENIEIIRPTREPLHDILPKLVNSKPELSSFYKARLGWNKIKNNWIKAESFFESVLSRGVIATVEDVLNINNDAGNKVSPEILKLREKSCFGDETNKPCPFLKYNKANEPYCSTCGCGDTNKLAVLKTNSTKYSKLEYPYLECPLKNPGFSNHEEIYSDLMAEISKVEHFDESIYPRITPTVTPTVTPTLTPTETPTETPVIASSTTSLTALIG